MKNSILLILPMILFAKVGLAQSTEQDGIRKTINTLFDAMKKGDSTLLRTTFHKSAVLHTISAQKDGTVLLGNKERIDDFAKAVGTPHTQVWDERITITDIKIDGDLASVWVPYKFYLGGNYSHCGVDSFQLMKTADGWKIIYLVDTRRKDKCPE
ncbi:nuclear transport factor 2 family protein [Mucilaginibacter sp. RS28]|uniref:Nuclear transport factor 2 family protein n=1 Tax=Mucilaginibacter straminoryzae TaxID=2932774 RepID=A0A9X1X2I5_9SPHI|nr:nuclear transport factor 2 family protein [Mucilaginibacter straminoryzae]MCJ8208795.1 nuclear transport factor 2 family protein [Mucilaginibacter straminoryzae]